GPPPSKLVRSAVAGLLLCALAAACTAPPPFAQLSGLILDAKLAEVSGIAASHRHEDVLWVTNDGGNAARLYAINRRGAKLATYRVLGAENTDWEDLASFRLDGRDWLLVADTGDNGGLRRTLQLHVFAEPERIADGVLRPAWTIVFRWPDGARDCEAVAVDAARGEVLLVSKKRQPPELFSLPLRPPRGGGTLVAWPLGKLAGVPQGDKDEVAANPELARIRSQVTAADIAPDGRTFALLTYRDVLLYARRGREDWGTALARRPAVHALPLLPQAEALAWSADGLGLYVTGEFSPAPLLYLNPGR
ncbi:MAG TPA: hypothetical protein VFM52_04890, partial [Rhodanobacter sp.]|nr:hypothetical protein [Rhodanobacter sp.]